MLSEFGINGRDPLMSTFDEVEYRMILANVMIPSIAGHIVVMLVLLIPIAIIEAAVLRAKTFNSILPVAHPCLLRQLAFDHPWIAARIPFCLAGCDTCRSVLNASSK